MTGMIVSKRIPNHYESDHERKQANDSLLLPNIIDTQIPSILSQLDVPSALNLSLQPDFFPTQYDLRQKIVRAC